MQLAEGWQPWVLPPLVMAGIAFAGTPIATWAPIAGAGLLVLAAGTAWFFRDPDREPGEGIVAAADGRLASIDDDAVTFLNIHNVHVVRAPYAGTVDRVERVDGSHAPAFLDHARHNQGIEITVNTDWGPQRVRLLVGLVARRAVSYVEEGDELAKGQRLGMIRLGSRVDVDLPETVEPAAREGQPVRAGETTIAHPEARA